MIGDYASCMDVSMQIENEIMILADKLGVSTARQNITDIFPNVFKAVNRKFICSNFSDERLVLAAIYIRNTLERPQRQNQGLVPLAFEMDALYHFLMNYRTIDREKIKKFARDNAKAHAEANNTTFPTFEGWSKDMQAMCLAFCTLNTALSVLEKWTWWTECLSFRK